MTRPDARPDARPGAGSSRRLGRVHDRVLDALAAVDAGRPADVALRRVEARSRDLGAAERSTLREQVYGVLRQRRRVEDALSRAAAAERRSLAELEPPVRLKLEVLAYRALQDDLPAPLEVFDPPTYRRFRPVLERIAHGRLPKRRTDNEQAIEFNLPTWLWELMERGLGLNEALRVGRALLGRAPLAVRAQRSGVGELQAELRDAGISARPTVLSPVGLILPSGTDLRSLDAFREGRLEVQDEGSQLVGLAASSSGGRTLDACAGAGGKTLQLAEAGASVTALEPDDRKRKELVKRIERAGLRARVHGTELEAFAVEHPESFDRVLVDAPCTGTGTLRRHPDLAARLSPTELERDVARQRRLAAAAARCTKPGGRLVYATCSVLPEENEAIADYMARELPELHPEAVFEGILGERIAHGSRVRIGPGPEVDGPDGFFIAAFAKRS